MIAYEQMNLDDRLDLCSPDDVLTKAEEIKSILPELAAHGVRLVVEWRIQELAANYDDLKNRFDVLAIALGTIASISEGSTTANSLPNIAKIARGALSQIRS